MGSVYVTKNAAQEVEDLTSPVDENALNESDSDNEGPTLAVSAKTGAKDVARARGKG